MSEDKGITLYSTKELADMFHKDVETIRRWIRSGYLPARKMGGTYYIEEEVLKRVLRGEGQQGDNQ